ncbi:MAG: hypothetical protein IMX01_10185 [Limnochordaceae bacterium]|nr:hypothetical protein [Limnochordaceae bacterium]
MGVASFSGGVPLSLDAVPAFFWLLALVHSLAEFSPLRPGHFDLAERQGYHWLKHWLVLALFTLGWVGVAWSPTGWQSLGFSPLRWPAVAVAGLVLAVHAVIDLGGRAAVSWSSRRHSGNRAAIAWGFVASQTLHLLAIWWIAQTATLPVPFQFGLTDTGVAGPIPSMQQGNAYFAWLLMSSTYFRWAAAGVGGWILFGGAIFIRLALATPRLRLGADQGLPQPERAGESPVSSSSPAPATPPRTSDPGETEQIGVYVGLLERLLTLVFFVMGQVAAVGFLVAAKSIARYKELEDREFAEYYLVGTLLSFALAIAGFLVLQAVGLATFSSYR